MTREAWKYVGFTVVAIVLAIVLGWLLLRAVQSAAENHARWVAWCGEQGGHVAEHKDTRVGTGYAANTNGKGGGSVVTTVSTSTTYYCLSEMGGILDIR